MKWLNNTIYPVRKIGDYPQIYVERVLTDKKDKALKISFFAVKDEPGYAIFITKKDARLLNKRIKLALGVI